jgi:hypothetical protein
MKTLEQISNSPRALIIKAKNGGNSTTSSLEVGNDSCKGTDVRVGIPRIEWLHVNKLPVGCYKHISHGTSIDRKLTSSIRLCAIEINQFRDEEH